MYGRCLCGVVEFEVTGAIPRLYQCHCSLCRRQGGTASNTATLVGAAGFRWLTGKEHVSSWTKDTGFRSDFCSRCGSPVPNRLRSTPYYWVPIGLLDDEPELQIAVHVFVGSKASWDLTAQQGVRFETIPELSELIALLHGGNDA